VRSQPSEQWTRTGRSSCSIADTTVTAARSKPDIWWSQWVPSNWLNHLQKSHYCTAGISLPNWLFQKYCCFRKTPYLEGTVGLLWILQNSISFNVLITSIIMILSLLVRNVHFCLHVIFKAKSNMTFTSVFDGPYLKHMWQYTEHKIHLTGGCQFCIKHFSIFSYCSMSKNAFWTSYNITLHIIQFRPKFMRKILNKDLIPNEPGNVSQKWLLDHQGLFPGKQQDFFTITSIKEHFHLVSRISVWSFISTSSVCVYGLHTGMAFISDTQFH
jgi:hypothetical protein